MPRSTSTMNSIVPAFGDLGDTGDQVGVKVIRRMLYSDPSDWPNHARVKFDFSALIAFMEKYQRIGFDRPLVYNLVLRELLELSHEQFGDFLLQMNALAKEHGWPGFIWSIGDENDASPARLRQARMLLTMVNQYVPDSAMVADFVDMPAWKMPGLRKDEPTPPNTL